MKFDDTDGVRNKVPLPVKRDVAHVHPAERVHPKYSAESGDELPAFQADMGGAHDHHKQEDDSLPDREDDIADIGGLGADVMTPEISNVMNNMMQEITRLRGDLDSAQNRIAFLEGLSDHDPVAGCLSAPALIRHVSQVLLLDEKAGTTSSLALVTIKDWEAIHHGMNRKADETVISHLGQLLKDNVRTGDVVGHTADDEFAVIFVASDLSEAEGLVSVIQGEINQNQPRWAAGTIKIETVWSTMSIAEYENADDVMASADNLMRKKLQNDISSAVS